MVEQHQLHYPAKNNMSPSREYNDLLKDLTEYQHNILIDLGNYSFICKLNISKFMNTDCAFFFKVMLMTF